MKADAIKEPGKYWYSRPNWSSPSLVEIDYIDERLDKTPELVVWFDRKYYPTSLKDFPDDGNFENA